MLNAAEKRLISEWMDLGGKYYNDPFNANNSAKITSPIMAVAGGGRITLTAPQVTDQFDASKRFSWSIDVDRFVDPSMEIELSSHNTINLFSLRWPPRSMASWLIPSMRQPSPTTA